MNNVQYGLSSETVKRITGIFAGYKEIEEVVLYGSRAKGNYKPGSDVDFTLKGKRLNLKLLNKINSDLDDLLLPYSFDLCIYSYISNNDLIEHIRHVGKVFYNRRV